VRQLFGGTTIVEFGGGAAGPIATRYFADHGATVIRVESRRRPDFLRILRLTPTTPGGLDGSAHFAVLNVNKLSVALDLSRPEGGIVCLTESILTYTANDEILTRMGNRSRHAAPHGVFRAADDDGRECWVAIAVHDDEDWRRLVAALGCAAWAARPALATLAGRQQHVGEIEARLEEWT